MAMDISKEVARLKRKKAKAAEELQYAQGCKKYNLTYLGKLPTSRQIEAKWKKQARALPKEKRQEVLDAHHAAAIEGGTIQGVMTKCGVTMEEYYGIIKLNTRVVKWETVNRETV